MRGKGSFCDCACPIIWGFVGHVVPMSHIVTISGLECLMDMPFMTNSGFQREWHAPDHNIAYLLDCAAMPRRSRLMMCLIETIEESRAFELSNTSTKKRTSFIQEEESESSYQQTVQEKL